MNFGFPSSRNLTSTCSAMEEPRDARIVTREVVNVFIEQLTEGSKYDQICGLPTDHMMMFSRCCSYRNASGIGTYFDAQQAASPSSN